MAHQSGSATYHFDVFRLDPARGVALRQDGCEMRLRPKAFALLRYFLDNPGRLLSRDELIGALWPGVAVTDDSLTQCVGELRQAFGDHASRILRTVPKRGYALVTEVRHGELPSKSAPEAGLASPGSAARDLAALRREVLAVHRFETPDGDPACVRLASGLATDLTAMLTCLEGLRVLPAGEDAARQGFSVKGEVRAIGQDLRTTVRLEEATTGVSLWAERLQQHRDSLPELPANDMITLIIHLGQQVDRHCLAVARQRPLSALSARELHLIGRDHHGRATAADFQLAQQMFSRAIAADPDYAHAFAWQAFTVHRAASGDWGTPAEQTARDEALRLARRAVQIDPTSPLCLSCLAYALMLDGQWDDAVAMARSALAAERPAFTAARNPCCEVLAHAGHPAEAAELARGTLTLDQLAPPATQALLGRALLLAGQAEAALAPLRLCASRLPDYSLAYDSLVTAAVEAGRVPEAQAARRELARLTPGWTPRRHTGFWSFRRVEDLERFEAAYRRVGGPGAPYPAARPGAERLRPLPVEDLVALRQDTLVVHPIRTLSDETASVQISSAFAAALMTELVRYENLRVLTAGDSRVADYAIRGDLAPEDGRIHLHVRLEDLPSGIAIWAKQVDVSPRRAANAGIEAATLLAAEIITQIMRKSLERARVKPEEALTAHEITRLGMQRYQLSTEDDTAASRRMFLRAIDIDPGFALPHAWHALAAARAVQDGWTGICWQGSAEQAGRSARRAIALDPSSPVCNAALATVLASQAQWDEAVVAARMALGGNRMAGNTARCMAGDVLTSAGYPAEAERALRPIAAWNPHTSPFIHGVLGRALLMAGRAAEAVGELRQCSALLPDYALCHRTLAVAATEAGLIDDARRAISEIARLRPGWLDGGETISWGVRRATDVERYQAAFDEALRIASIATGGLPAAANGPVVRLN